MHHHKRRRATTQPHRLPSRLRSRAVAMGPPSPNHPSAARVSTPIPAHSSLLCCCALRPEPFFEGRGLTNTRNNRAPAARTRLWCGIRAKRPKPQPWWDWARARASAGAPKTGADRRSARAMKDFMMRRNVQDEEQTRRATPASIPASSICTSWPMPRGSASRDNGRHDLAR